MPSYIHMESHENLYFHVEIGEIWEYIRSYMYNHRNHDELIFELHEFFKDVVIQSGQEPFMTLKDYKSGKVPDSYYENYQNLENGSKERFLIDFFSQDGDFYDFNIVSIIRKGTVKYMDFAKLFYLKLYTYKEDQGVMDSFLRFHYLDNFYGNLHDYLDFLDIVMSKIIPLEYSEAVKKYLESWIFHVSPHKIPLNTILTQDEKDKNSDGQEIKISSNDARTSIMTDNRKYIKPSFTSDELIHYFSFLYKEKSENKLPFLSEENVKEIFKDGLILPSAPLEKKFTLNCSLRYPKTIMDFAIHKLYKLRIERDKINDKSLIVIFFASYLTDYEKALVSELHLKSIMSNINGTKPGRTNIKLENYIPDYTEKTKHNS